MFSEIQIEEWGIENEDDIQVNCILQELVLSSTPMSIMQDEIAKDHDLQQLKEDIIRHKKCRRGLNSYSGIFKELSCLKGLILRWRRIVVPEKLQSDVIGLAHEGHFSADKKLP